MSSKEVQPLPSNYKILGNSYICPKTLLTYKGKIYQTSEGIFVLNELCYFLKKNGKKILYYSYDPLMKIFGFYNEYIFVFKEKSKNIYFLTEKKKYLLEQTTAVFPKENFLSFYSCYNIVYNIFPWNFRKKYYNFLSKNQKNIVYCSLLCLKRLKVNKFIVRIIMSFL